MPALTVPFNTANPLCSANQCLQQVIGSLDDNPLDQYAACVSMFGSPTTTTVSVGTVPGEGVISTSTTTIPYTDIIVTLSTTESTHYETSASYAEVLEVITAYSATSVVTVTEVVTAPTTSVLPGKKRGYKNRGCGRPSSALSSSSELSTATPTSSSSTLYPIASNCAGPEEYSSACSCIYAVSTDVITTVTVPGETSVVTVTESSAVASTSTSIATVVVSSTVVVPATITLASTTTGLSQTTTTATSTTTPVAPTQTSYLVLTGARAGLYVKTASPYLMVTTGGTADGARFQLITAGGQPSLASDTTRKLFVHQANPNYGVLVMETDAQAASLGDPAATCTLDSEVFSCSAPAKGFDTLYNCGAYLYLGKATWTQSGCFKTNFKMSA